MLFGTDVLAFAFPLLLHSQQPFMVIFAGFYDEIFALFRSVVPRDILIQFVPFNRNAILLRLFFLHHEFHAVSVKNPFLRCRFHALRLRQGGRTFLSLYHVKQVGLQFFREVREFHSGIKSHFLIVHHCNRGGINSVRRI